MLAEAEADSMFLKSREHPELLAAPGAKREEAQSRSPSGSQLVLRASQFGTSGSQNCQRIEFCGFKPPVCGPL